ARPDRRSSAGRHWPRKRRTWRQREGYVRKLWFCNCRVPGATVHLGGWSATDTWESVMKKNLPPSWQKVLGEEFDKPYFQELEEFVDSERAAHKVFPPEDEVFNAFQQTPFNAVEVVLLGQDPYHGDNQAHGLCFSVRPGVPQPPSLKN